MKKILLGLFLILSLQSFAQNNFRGMSWDASISQLKSKYPDINWKIENENKTKIYTTEDHVGGLEVGVAYFFIDNQLKMGAYYFTEEHKSNNLYYEDFVSISNILNKKYDMEKDEKWNNTSWKDSPNRIGHALLMGHVEIEERYEDELTKIIHSLSNNNSEGIQHFLFYADMAHVKKMKASQNEDF